MVATANIPRLDGETGQGIGWWKTGDEVLVRCHRGHIGILGKVHRVDPEGRVRPSMRCPRSACDWHVFGVLLDWKGER